MMFVLKTKITNRKFKILRFDYNHGNSMIWSNVYDLLSNPTTLSAPAATTPVKNETTPAVKNETTPAATATPTKTTIE
jgi:hypothetical protein